ncbi:MAG TPA: hypothetical protein DCE78_03095 [Bacteroidetes bacterium]|nr:hypothetical protein [Bacteroidota bacterium]
MKYELIHIAQENLEKNAGIDIKWQDNGPLDGKLVLTINGQKFTYVVDVKHELRTHQLHQIEEHFHRNEHFLVLAKRIFPKIKEELRQKGIPYIEANGNIFLKRDNLFLFVDTQKPLDVDNNKGNRAFTKTGLKVLFYLLQHKEAINLTQREIAENTGVGLGNIPQVIDGLKQTGFLIHLNKDMILWENRKTLLDRWIAEYATVLRPKLVKERYTLKNDWKLLTLNHQKTVWGGEPAADILTNYLRPEKLILFTKENRIDLIKNYKFMPDKYGEIEVLEMFWEQTNEKTAPPLLIYADLMLEGGKRNKETAQIIYNEYIEPNL